MTAIATRFDIIEENGTQTSDERDVLLEVEAGGEDGWVDLHIGPRTADVLTVGIKVDQARQLVWDLMLAIVESERDG